MHQRSRFAEFSGLEPSQGGAVVTLDLAYATDHIRPEPPSDTNAKAYKRERQMLWRLIWSRSLLDNAAHFGRYLKLCALIEWANDMNEIARWRLL
jgi:hypothetical protein